MTLLYDEVDRHVVADLLGPGGASTGPLNRYDPASLPDLDSAVVYEVSSLVGSAYAPLPNTISTTFALTSDSYPGIVPPHANWWTEWSVPAEARRTLGATRLGVWAYQVAVQTDDTSGRPLLVGFPGEYADLDYHDNDSTGWNLAVMIFGDDGRGLPPARRRGARFLAAYLVPIRRDGTFTVPQTPVSSGWDRDVAEALVAACDRDGPMRGLGTLGALADALNGGTAVWDLDPKTLDAIMVEFDQVRAVLGDGWRAAPIGALGTVTRMREAAAVRDFADVSARLVRLLGLPPFLYALMLLGCTNHVVDRHRPDVRLSKARARRGRSTSGWRTIDIVRPGTTRRYFGDAIATGDGLVSASIVRGHPAHYGDCCPGVHEPRGRLFGKYEGRVFVPQHTRGSGTPDTSAVRRVKESRPTT